MSECPCDVRDHAKWCVETCRCKNGARFKTVGDLRAMIEGLPDLMMVYLDDGDGISHLVAADASDVMEPAEGPCLLLVGEESDHE